MDLILFFNKKLSQAVVVYGQSCVFQFLLSEPFIFIEVEKEHSN